MHACPDLVVRLSYQFPSWLQGLQIANTTQHDGLLI